MGALRFPIAFALGSVVSITLFAFLRAMVGSTEEMAEPTVPPKIEFLQLRRPSEIEEKKREKPEREKPEPQPVVSDQLRISNAATEVAAQTLDIDLSPGAGVELEGVAIGPGGGGAGFLVAPGAGDRDAIPLVRVDPTYPERAAAQKLEGWVEVEFTISRAGTVKDPHVVASSSPLFHNEVVRAVRKWKYQPKIEDGEPVERTGVRVLLRFTLEGKTS